jgi:hypothetical protein
MREISLDEQPKTVLPVNTFLTYGETKTGKTTFAGTSPRPLFFSDGSEHGYESLRGENWNNDETPLFEKNVAPIVWVLETEKDFHDAIEKARPLVSAGVVKTIWIDSITFFADLIFNSILMGQTSKRDNRQAYGELGVRMRNIRIKLSSLQTSIGWLAHVKHPDEEHPAGGPLIPGQQATKVMGSVDFLFYTRLDQSQPSQPPTYMMHTAKYGAYPAGHRLGVRGQHLPNPFVGNYAGLLDTIGYDVPAIRASLVPIDKARADAKKMAQAKAAEPVAPPVAASTQPAAKPPVAVKTTTTGNNGKTATVVKQ